MLLRKRASTCPSRKHSKTFTGCWTCRARKVKCDELRPSCRQCLQKRLDCGGYDVRLQWTSPETGDPEAASTSTIHQSVQAKCHRSRVTWASLPESIPSHEIDSIMQAIDSVRSVNEIEPLQSESRPGPELSLQYFGVFDSSVTYEGTPPAKPARSTPSLLSQDIDQETSLTDTTEPTSWSQFVPLESFVASEGPQEQFLDLWSDPGFQDSGFSELTGAAYDGHGTLNHGALENILVQHDSNRDASSGHVSWHEVLPSYVPQTPSPTGLDSQQRFLLHHYANRVVNLFTALENSKSPWKAIHLPRALQNAGEIVIKGSSTDAKNGLRNALISISAFSLSNDYRTQDRLVEAYKWSSVASSYRGKAIKHLQKIVDSELTGGTRPKYKECLATMLSMVSINVYSGDTETCAMHLDGAHRLIIQSKNWKTKYSNKALGLHRIYFYLRTIYQSTALTAGRSRSGVSKSDLPVGSSLYTIIPLESTENPPSMSPSVHQPIDMCTHVLLYGVPYSLLIMLSKTIDLVNCVIEEKARTGSRILSTDLALLCNEHEDVLMAWEPEITAHVATPDSPALETNAKIITLMTRAFHNAVVIYFAQHVRLLAHYYMQPYISRVIDSIEEIERVKAETEVLAAPLYWPAFIAASEAFDLELQDRFRWWYDQVEAYGIGSARTGFEVLCEVWKRGPCPGETLTSIWRLVVQESETVLLLS